MSEDNPGKDEKALLYEIIENTKELIEETRSQRREIRSLQQEIDVQLAAGELSLFAHRVDSEALRRSEQDIDYCLRGLEYQMKQALQRLFGL